jgi:hypothetical protein
VSGEPSSVRAGTTWSWQRLDLTLYPSPTWVLTYYFKRADAQFQAVAAADGIGGHVVSIAAADNGAYTSGVYVWIALVSNAGVVHEVDTGTIDVLPNIANTEVLDTRTQAQQNLEMIDAYLANANNLAAATYTIAGRSLSRIARAELREERNYWAAKVAAEQRAERQRRGQPIRNRIYTRG